MIKNAYVVCSSFFWSRLKTVIDSILLKFKVQNKALNIANKTWHTPLNSKRYEWYFVCETTDTEINVILLAVYANS